MTNNEIQEEMLRVVIRGTGMCNVADALFDCLHSEEELDWFIKVLNAKRDLYKSIGEW